MSVPPSSTTQPPIPVGDASKSVLLAAQVMTLPSVTSTSTSQYSAETLITILERPSTSLSQSVDVVMETPDPEVILPGKLPTVATRLCDPLAVTLPLHHSTPLEPPSFQETPARFGTQHISPVSDQSSGPPVLSPQNTILTGTTPSTTRSSHRSPPSFLSFQLYPFALLPLAYKILIREPCYALSV